MGPQFMIPYLDDSREGIVAALEIRKDRTPTVLRKLGKAEAERVWRAASWRSPTLSTA